jgi:hypothetical protein
MVGDWWRRNECFNRLGTLRLDRFGRPGAPVVTQSSGTTPFGFDFDRRDHVPVGQGAACWVAVSPNSRFVYTGNAAGSISGFRIDWDGTLTPLDADGLTALLPTPFTPATSSSTAAGASSTRSVRAVR